MAIAARTRPEFIISGPVARTRDISKKDSGELLGVEFTVTTAGGDARVTAWASDAGDTKLPTVGGNLAAVVSVTESQQGASLVFRRLVNSGDLDLVNSHITK